MGPKLLFAIAGVLALVGVGLIVLDAQQMPRPAVSAQALASELEAPLREALAGIEARADTLAALPSLHDSVSTDAETVRDQTQRERSFQPRAGETMTIAQVPVHGDPVVLLVLPDGGTAVAHPERAGTRFEISNRQLVVVDVVPVTPSEPSRAAELKGALAIVAPVELSSLKERLAALAAKLRIVVDGHEVQLGDATSSRTLTMSVPLTIAGVQATATVPQVAKPALDLWLGGIALFAAFVIAALALTRPPAERVARPAPVSRPDPRSEGSTLDVPVPGWALGSGVHTPVIVEGTVIDGTYEVVGLIGKGGMGTVWEARHMRLPDKRVAIKILTIEGQTAEHLARFRREAEITSRLGHPNIIDVLDFNTLPMGAPYIVLEYLVGRTLADRITLGRVPLSETLELVRQLASALHAAHRAGVVHRDLKPDNVFLVPTGYGTTATVKVLDFGISKIRGNLLVQTQDALVFGTPQYMSPEQASGRNKDVDARSDVWSLGAIVHEMLTGTPAFEGDSMGAILSSVISGPTPSLRGRDEIPPHVAAAVERALDKDPARRWPDMPSFLAALEG